MRFDHLQASIHNNLQQEPTLYMALCMMESLMADVEDACGGEVGHCPVGDESLPNKLIWLCRVVNEIYSEQGEQLQRNRKRLDAAVEKLNQTQLQLQQISGVTNQLVALREKAAELEEKLEARHAEVDACEALEAQCERMRNQLELLKQFDAAAARRELEALEQQIHARQQEKTGLDARLLQNKQTAAQLQQELEEAAKQDHTLQCQIEKMKEDLANGEAVAAQGNQELASMKQACDALARQCQQMLADKEAADQHYSKLVARRDKFSEEEMLPTQIALDTLRQQLENLEQDKFGLLSEEAEMKAARLHLIQDISRQKIDNEDLKQRLLEAQDKLDQQNQEYRLLEADWNQCVYALENIQNAVEQLKEQKLPEVLQLQEQEQARCDELIQRQTQAEADREACQKEIQRLEEQLPKLEEDLRDVRTVYEALTTKFTANSKELEQLDNKIKELQSNTEEQKLETYRKQLAEKMQELEQIQADCLRLEAENTQKEQELEAGQNQRAKLRERKQSYDSALEATQKQLAELAFAGEDTYIQQLRNMEERVKLLQSVRDKLAASMDNMRRILGKAPFVGGDSMEERVKTDLRILKNHVEELRCALLDCAKAYKMEEQ